MDGRSNTRIRPRRPVTPAAVHWSLLCLFYPLSAATSSPCPSSASRYAMRGPDPSAPCPVAAVGRRWAIPRQTAPPTGWSVDAGLHPTAGCIARTFAALGLGEVGAKGVQRSGHVHTAAYGAGGEHVARERAVDPQRAPTRQPHGVRVARLVARRLGGVGGDAGGALVAGNCAVRGSPAARGGSERIDPADEHDDARDIPAHPP